MGENRRQHYVPKFYLSKFGAGSRQVDLLNLSSGQLVRGASIKGQCYRNNFYGADGELERAFATHEAQLAPIFRRVHEDPWIPQRNTEDWVSVMTFIAMQHNRTQAAATLTDEMFDESTRQLLAEDGRFDEATLSAMRVKATNPVQISLSSALDAAMGLDDLQPLLLTAANPSFVTSDHPVALYNTYAESVTWAGVTGVLCSGLQVFYPLTPSCCLLLYDGKVYGVTPKRAMLPVTSSDAEQINKVIASQAGRNIYFGPWFGDEEAHSLARAVARVRLSPRIKFEKADEVLEQPRANGIRRVLMHMFFPVPVVRPKLSMIRLRKRAEKTPIHERGSQWRKHLRPRGIEPCAPLEPGTFRVRRP
ncbi:DUF4238 domain-containing protein [Enhygromyxa salina]|uniref:DUF4238 domain-containing protein n=1 Tax=Enhygromyxa salina TaxID=215803 RepID=UPI000696352E|nr:DUF4238 domain-containing protein [Enhygromyxa salina]